MTLLTKTPMTVDEYLAWAVTSTISIFCYGKVGAAVAPALRLGLRQFIGDHGGASANRGLKPPSFPATTIVCFSGHALLCPFRLCKFGPR
jgi:hypothetical protein